jgi:hypothetical protein
MDVKDITNIAASQGQNGIMNIMLLNDIMDISSIRNITIVMDILDAKEVLKSCVSHFAMVSSHGFFVKDDYSQCNLFAKKHVNKAIIIIKL